MLALKRLRETYAAADHVAVLLQVSLNNTRIGLNAIATKGRNTSIGVKAHLDPAFGVPTAPPQNVPQMSAYETLFNPWPRPLSIPSGETRSPI
jgi:hypothetical protein